MNKFEKYGSVIWKNGAIITPSEASTSVMSHAMHYATSWFEGIRTYKTDKGTAILMLDEHMKRMLVSPLLHGWDFSQHVSVEELKSAAIEIVALNNIGNGYIRPLLYLGIGWDSLNPIEEIEYNAMISTWELTHLYSKRGIGCALVKRPRISSAMIPMESKCAANYTNSLLLKKDAKDAGFDEAIALDINGNISEASTANIFMVKDNVLYTPSVDCSILNGLTRQLVIKIARELLNLKVIEGKFKSDFLFELDEIFITGSAAGIVSVTNVNNTSIGTKAYDITNKIINIYEEIVSDKHAWSDELLTYV